MTFSGVSGSIKSWSTTEIVVVVPVIPNASSNVNGDVIVKVDGEGSNAMALLITPQASISTISPSSGPPGTLVTIYGETLLDAGNKGTVTFNGKSLPILSQGVAGGDGVNSYLQVAVPTGAVTGVFTVFVNNTTLTTPTFTVHTIIGGTSGDPQKLGKMPQLTGSCLGG